MHSCLIDFGNQRSDHLPRWSTGLYFALPTVQKALKTREEAYISVLNELVKRVISIKAQIYDKRDYFAFAQKANALIVLELWS